MTFRLDRNIIALMTILMFSVPAMAQDDKKAEDSTAEKTEEIKAKVDPNFTVRMKNNKFLQGLPMEFGFIDVYILGTKVSVPLEDVSGIRVGADANDKGTVALKNGDILNGRIDLPELKLAVDWGQAIINRDMVKSMVRTNDLYWQMKDTPNGPMWFLAPRYYRSSSSTQPAQAPKVKPSSNKVVPATFAATSSTKAKSLAFPAHNNAEFAWIW
jgi:hypothetical protein